MRNNPSNRSRWLVALSVLLVGLVVVIAIAAALAPTLLPVGDQTNADSRRVAAGVIFVGSYLALAIGTDSRPEHRPGRHRASRRWPHGRIGRPSA
jgi:hypothetical protein